MSEWTRELEQQLKAAGYTKSERELIEYEITRGNTLDSALDKVDEVYPVDVELDDDYVDEFGDSLRAEQAKWPVMKMYEEIRPNVWKYVADVQVDDSWLVHQVSSDDPDYIHVQMFNKNYKFKK